MNTLAVELANHSYPIHVGEGLPGCGPLFAIRRTGWCSSRTNETIGPLYLDSLGALDGCVESVALPDGESFKTFATLNRIFDVLIEHRFGRDVTIIVEGWRCRRRRRIFSATNAASITSDSHYAPRSSRFVGRRKNCH